MKVNRNSKKEMHDASTKTMVRLQGLAFHHRNGVQLQSP